MFQTKVVEEIKNTFCVQLRFLFLKILAVYKTMWKYMAKQYRPQVTI